jgi:methylphosphotriester-DNA--protein-cysteine methyltransferase
VRVPVRSGFLENEMSQNRTHSAVGGWKNLVVSPTRFYGVTTTGIFCRFGCPSRTPRAENVVLFDAVDHAIARGFRSCKRCRPDDEVAPARAFEGFITRQFVALSGEDPGARISDLASMLSVSTRQLERIVRRTTGMSPRELEKKERESP